VDWQLKQARELGRAAFIDKDGTLIDDLPYNVDPDRITLAPGAAQGAAMLSSQGYRLIVVSNQPGVAMGLFPEYALQAVQRRLRDLLASYGVPLDGFYYCPHVANDGRRRARLARYGIACECRKPRPGMLLHAATAHRIDLSRSWMIGDILDDIEAGTRAGCRTALIDNGNETEWDLGAGRRPHVVGRDMREAVALLIASSETGQSMAAEGT
jgi:D-glycero-D-manno-heptose 1,7-bisphosphate phosphatase